MKCKKLQCVALAGGVAFLMGCTPAGWSEYRSGMRCTLKDDPDCAKYYQEAIEKNPALPGLHSSYGTYLYTKGNKVLAAEQFQKEVAQYPQSKKAVEIALNPSLSATPPTTSDTTHTTIEVIQ